MDQASGSRDGTPVPVSELVQFCQELCEHEAILLAAHYDHFTPKSKLYVSPTTIKNQTLKRLLGGEVFLHSNTRSSDKPAVVLNLDPLQAISKNRDKLGGVRLAVSAQFASGGEELESLFVEPPPGSSVDDKARKKTVLQQYLDALVYADVIFLQDEEVPRTNELENLKRQLALAFKIEYEKAYQEDKTQKLQTALSGRKDAARFNGCLLKYIGQEEEAEDEAAHKKGKKKSTVESNERIARDKAIITVHNVLFWLATLRTGLLAFDRRLERMQVAKTRLYQRPEGLADLQGRQPVPGEVIRPLRASLVEGHTYRSLTEAVLSWVGQASAQLEPLQQHLKKIERRLGLIQTPKLNPTDLSGLTGEASDESLAVVQCDAMQQSFNRLHSDEGKALSANYKGGARTEWNQLMKLCQSAEEAFLVIAEESTRLFSTNDSGKISNFGGQATNSAVFLSNLVVSLKPRFDQKFQEVKEACHHIFRDIALLQRATNWQQYHRPRDLPVIGDSVAAHFQAMHNGAKVDERSGLLANQGGKKKAAQGSSELPWSITARLYYPVAVLERSESRKDKVGFGGATTKQESVTQDSSPGFFRRHRTLTLGTPLLLAVASVAINYFVCISHDSCDGMKAFFDMNKSWYEDRSTPMQLVGTFAVVFALSSLAGIAIAAAREKKCSTPHDDYLQIM